MLIEHEGVIIDLDEVKVLLVSRVDYTSSYINIKFDLGAGTAYNFSLHPRGAGVTSLDAKVADLEAQAKGFKNAFVKVRAHRGDIFVRWRGSRSGIIYSNADCLTVAEFLTLENA